MSVLWACHSSPVTARARAHVVVRNDGARRMDAYLDAAQHFGFSAAMLVADGNGVVLRKGYGPAGNGRPITADMLFDIGSMTKQFTAAAILLLESEGKLAVTDRLTKHFPNVPADKANITLHQLLTHTSGVVENVQMTMHKSQPTRSSGRRSTAH